MIAPPSSGRTLFLWSLAIYFCNGVAFGVFANSDVIAARTLHASAGGVAALMFLLNASLIFSLPLVRWLGAGLVFRSRVRRMAWACTLPLFAYPLIPFVPTFIAAVFCVHLLNTILPPVMNRLYDRHLTRNLGRFYGWATSLKILAGMGAAMATGVLLDFDERLHVPLLWAAALLALLSTHLLAVMEPGADAAPTGSLWRHMRATAACVREVLAQDAAFLRFERNFIIYGLGFLMLTPVIPLYLVRELHLDYSVISFSRQVVGQAALWLLSPVAGLWFDRTSPFGFTGFSFLILLGFPLVLAGAGLLPLGSAAAVILAYAIQSVAMTGISIAWNIGSIRFAGSSEPGLYQGVHVTLTGVRSLFGPLLGWAVLETLGYRAAFFMAAGLFAAATLLMLTDPSRKSGLFRAASPASPHP